MKIEYAYLWDKGPAVLSNPDVLCVESVMTTSGPVFLALLSESESFANAVISWFYEYALPILRERGMCRLIQSTFRQRIGKKGNSSGDNAGVILIYRRYCFLFFSGNRYQIKGVGSCFSRIQKKEMILISTGNLFERIGEETVFRKLNVFSSDEADRFLQEMKRRARSRGEAGAMNTIWIRIV